MNAEELKKILDEHKLWLQSAQNNGNRANFSNADLSYANFSNADLSYANFSNANLNNVRAVGADFSYVTFSNANFSYANFSNANFSYANLRDVRAVGANFSYVNFSHVCACGADFSNASFSNADFSNTDLGSAANITFKITPLYKSMLNILPEGDIIGWKKCRNDTIVKLLIPKRAKRSNAAGRKCRASYAKVLDIRDVKNKKIKSAVSFYASKFTYTKNKLVKCGKWDDNRWKECAGGIHFFITIEEAKNFIF